MYPDSIFPLTSCYYQGRDDVSSLSSLPSVSIFAFSLRFDPKQNLGHPAHIRDRTGYDDEELSNFVPAVHDDLSPATVQSWTHGRTHQLCGTHVHPFVECVLISNRKHTREIVCHLSFNLIRSDKTIVRLDVGSILDVGHENTHVSRDEPTKVGFPRSDKLSPESEKTFHCGPKAPEIKVYLTHCRRPLT